VGYSNQMKMGEEDFQNSVCRGVPLQFDLSGEYVGDLMIYDNIFVVWCATSGLLLR